MDILSLSAAPDRCDQLEGAADVPSAHAREPGICRSVPAQNPRASTLTAAPSRHTPDQPDVA